MFLNHKFTQAMGMPEKNLTPYLLSFIFFPGASPMTSLEKETVSDLRSDTVQTS